MTTVKTITDIVAENARLKEKLAAAEADLAKLREVVGEARRVAKRLSSLPVWFESKSIPNGMVRWCKFCKSERFDDHDCLIHRPSCEVVAAQSLLSKLSPATEAGTVQPAPEAKKDEVAGTGGVRVFLQDEGAWVYEFWQDDKFVAHCGVAGPEDFAVPESKTELHGSELAAWLEAHPLPAAAAPEAKPAGNAETKRRYLLEEADSTDMAARAFDGKWVRLVPWEGGK